MTKETRFYDALEKIFVGAQIEGEGGYVNLLKTKEKYYKNVLTVFKNEVNNDPIIDSSFKENFFELLYNFFDKYFSECGSVYFVKTANYQKVYEKVYSDEKDVVLFWKTNTLYYVKSDILFQSIFVNVDETNSNNSYVFFFDVGSLKQKQNNEKKDLIYSLKEIKEGKIKNVHNDKSGDKTFVLSVNYSERGRKTDLNLLSQTCGVNSEIIEKAIKTFEKQTTVDFFINKNAESFLNEQLDIFLHQYLLDERSEFDAKRLNQLKCFKNYALKLISFISQFENELVRIWNKPKFVHDSNYVVTLNKLNENVIHEIVEHTNFKKQLKEWVQLGMINDSDKISSKNIKEHLNLPIDTIYFKDIEFKILNCFENLEESLDGKLIKSENYQALNTLFMLYKNQVKCVYIDPPFNTGNDFEYMDEYQDSSWLSIIQDRLYIAQKMLTKDGSIFMHLDHFAEHRGRELMDSIFGKENFVNNLAWSYRSGGASDSKALPYKHDSILFYCRNKNYFELNPITERQYMNKNFMGAKKDSDGRFYTDTLLRDVFEGEIFDPNKNITYNVRKVLNLSNEFYSFKNSQKPEGLLHLLLTLSNVSKREIVMDFFAGSGPTLSVAQKMGCKFIGVEMGEHFNNFYQEEIVYKNSPTNKENIYKKFDVVKVTETEKKLNVVVNKVGLLGRMKEVIACSGRHEPCGISESVNWKGGGFIKYFSLEQYEDTLNKAIYEPEIDLVYEKDPFAQYIFFADKKFSEIIENQNDDVNLKFDKLCKNIDLPETISLILGKSIVKIDEDFVYLKDVEKPIKYNVSKMDQKEKIYLIQILKNVLWWGK